MHLTFQEVEKAVKPHGIKLETKHSFLRFTKGTERIDWWQNSKHQTCFVHSTQESTESATVDLIIEKLNKLAPEPSQNECRPVFNGSRMTLQRMEHIGKIAQHIGWGLLYELWREVERLHKENQELKSLTHR